MALTLDGIVPMGAMGGTSSGLGVGAGALGGGVAGLLLGGLLANNGNGGLFGNGNNNNNDVQFDALQSQIATMNSNINSHQIDDSITSINQNITGSTRDIQGAIGTLATAQATANFTTLTSINGLGRDITAAQNQAALQQLNSFNNLQFQNAQATNQIIAQGTANAMAMQQCCCEIKGAIAADGQATRQLINDLNVQNLRDQLAAANNKVSNNEQNQYLLSTILTHLSPATTATI